jgi:hypothetical protein
MVEWFRSAHSSSNAHALHFSDPDCTAKPPASSPIYSTPAVPLGVNSSSCKRIHHGPSVGLPRPFSSAPNLLLALLLISLYRAEADVPETISDAAASDNDLVHSAIVYRQTIAKARR